MLTPSLGWNVEPIGFVESGVGLHPAIAPRPKDVSDTVVQSRLGGRDVAPLEGDLPVLQAHPVGLLPAIGPRPKASAQFVCFKQTGGRDVAPRGVDLPVLQAHPVGLHEKPLVLPSWS